MRCGDCGQNMVKRSTTKNGKRYYYYHCSTYKNGEKISGLKPYIYYSCRYKRANGDDFVITYSLDNYITIYGKINNMDVYDYGYLIDQCGASR